MKSVVLTGLLAIVLGFFLMVPLAHLFDAMNWAVFNTWGLAHGSFVLAWPMLAYASFYLLRILIPALRGREQSH
jgi:D-alanyl-lipoteichoic acid acyltransferase DltB (MBOAT superfamily)